MKNHPTHLKNLFLTVAFLTACQSTTPAAPETPPVSPPPLSEPTSLPTQQTSTESLHKIGDNLYDSDEQIKISALNKEVFSGTLCPPQKNCYVEEVLDAGNAPNGNRFSIVGIRSNEAKKKPIPKEGEISLLCPDEHLWLVETDSNQNILRSEFVVTAYKDNAECNYGASGGDESISMVNHNLVYNMNGGSSWKWSVTKTFAVAPHVVALTQEESGFWGFGDTTNNFERNTELSSNLTHVMWNSPICGHEDEMLQDESLTLTYQYQFDEIPRMDAKDPWIANWKSAPQFNKPLKITNQSSDQNRGGYVIFGKPDLSSDVSFEVMAQNTQTYFVEIHDANILSGAKNWINDDHLEIWASDQRRPSYYNHCLMINDGKPGAPQPPNDEYLDGYVFPPVQWGVRLSDAKVYEGFGKSKNQPMIERVSPVNGDPTRVRLKITLPFDATGITFAYSKSDAGIKQKYILATSQVKFGNAATLGEITPSDSEN